MYSIQIHTEKTHWPCALQTLIRVLTAHWPRTPKPVGTTLNSDWDSLVTMDHAAKDLAVFPEGKHIEAQPDEASSQHARGHAVSWRHHDLECCVWNLEFVWMQDVKSPNT